jgi:hypothetical protein
MVQPTDFAIRVSCFFEENSKIADEEVIRNFITSAFQKCNMENYYPEIADVLIGKTKVEGMRSSCLYISNFTTWDVLDKVWNVLINKMTVEGLKAAQENVELQFYADGLSKPPILEIRLQKPRFNSSYLSDEISSFGIFDWRRVMEITAKLNRSEYYGVKTNLGNFEITNPNY